MGKKVYSHHPTQFDCMRAALFGFLSVLFVYAFSMSVSKCMLQFASITPEKKVNWHDQRVVLRHVWFKCGWRKGIDLRTVLWCLWTRKRKNRENFAEMLKGNERKEWGFLCYVWISLFVSFLYCHLFSSVRSYSRVQIILKTNISVIFNIYCETWSN